MSATSPRTIWTTEQKTAYASLKRSNVYRVVEATIEDRKGFTFEDVWYAVASEVDYYEIDPEFYRDEYGSQGLSKQSYAYAKKWMARTERFCREGQ